MKERKEKILCLWVLLVKHSLLWSCDKQWWGVGSAEEMRGGGSFPGVMVTLLTLQPEHGSRGSSDCHGPSAHQVQPFSLGSYCTSQPLICGPSFQSGNWGDCQDH